MDYAKATYEDLCKEQDRLEEQYNEISDDCAKEGLKYSEFQERAHDVKEKLYLVSKYKRFKQIPIVEYGKEWNGDLMTIEKFKNTCLAGGFVDDDGFGRYGTETALSDIMIIPSDVTENIIRTDFTHIIWFNR